MQSWALAVHLYCSAWVNSAFCPYMVTKSSTSFGWGKGGNVTSVEWQVTLCDPILYVSSRSSVAVLHCELLYPCTILLLVISVHVRSM